LLGFVSQEIGMGKRREIHDRVLNASSKEELESAYSEWAEHYDNDLVDEMGYVAPRIASRLLMDYATDNAAIILDAGCGTGLVGEFLNREGYENVEGLDYSTSMLEKAAEKKIYRNLSQGDLTASLDIPSDTYDAIISVGTFTCGHVGPEAFKELVRITKPQGYICVTVREEAWQEDRYREIVEDLQRGGSWDLLEQNSADYIKSEDSNCIVCLFQITK
jgi:predicted TPR repeat methyltransferase